MIHRKNSNKLAGASLVPQETETENDLINLTRQKTKGLKIHYQLMQAQDKRQK